MLTVRTVNLAMYSIKVDIADMNPMPNDNFLRALDNLIQTYPEYASVLIQFKSQIIQGNKAKIEAGLKQLMDGSF